VHRWLVQYRAEHEATTLLDRPRSGCPRLHRTLTPRRLAAALARDPRRCGYQATSWTVPLPAHDLAARGSRSARGRCDGGCTRRAIAGSARAMSMASARPICRRKWGPDPAAERGLAQGRPAAVSRLDAVAAVSVPARDLGAQGQAIVPITGRNAKRVLFGAIDLRTVAGRCWSAIAPVRPTLRRSCARCDAGTGAPAGSGC
jgi:hypothetical protein